MHHTELLCGLFTAAYSWWWEIGLRQFLPVEDLYSICPPSCGAYSQYCTLFNYAVCFLMIVELKSYYYVTTILLSRDILTRREQKEKENNIYMTCMETKLSKLTCKCGKQLVVRPVLELGRN
jgi:hypothetical protein